MNTARAASLLILLLILILGGCKTPDPLPYGWDNPASYDQSADTIIRLQGQLRANGI